MGSQASKSAENNSGNYVNERSQSELIPHSVVGSVIVDVPPSTQIPNAKKYDFSPLKITEDSRLVVPEPFQQLQSLGYKQWREIMNDEERKMIDETTQKIVRNVSIVGLSSLLLSYSVMRHRRMGAPFFRFAIPIAIGCYLSLVSAAIPFLKMVNRAQELPEGSVLKREMYMATSMKNEDFQRQLIGKQRQYQLKQLEIQHQQQIQSEIDFVQPSTELEDHSSSK